MKRLLIIAISCLFFAAGCAKEKVHTTEEENYYTVSLNFSGEISSFDEPLTKAGESRRLCGIWIGKDGSGTANHYGGGLFDNADNIKVNLLAGHTYYFRCTMVANGKDVVKTYDTRYGAPFWKELSVSSNYPDGSALTNKIGYNGIDDAKNNGGRMMQVSGLGITKSFQMTADRYYGEAFGVSPKENTSINIELKHTVVGVKYKVTGLTDGSIALTVKRGSNTFISESAISSNGEGSGKVFECSDILSAYQYSNSYKETATVSVVWKREIGITQNLGSVDVDLLRNRMNVIHINLGADDGDASLGINVDQTAMTEEAKTISVN